MLLSKQEEALAMASNGLEADTKPSSESPAPAPVPTAHPPSQPQTAQPPAQMPMTVSPVYGATHPVARPNPKGLQIDEKGQREWNHGLFSCTERCELCCTSFWCPCVVYGRANTRFTHLQLTGQPHPEGGESCGLPTWLYCGIMAGTGCNWVMDMFFRESAQKRYNISRSGCQNCMAAFFCLPCLQTQLLREIEDEENEVRQNATGQGQYPEQQLPSYEPKPQEPNVESAPAA